MVQCLQLLLLTVHKSLVIQIMVVSLHAEQTIYWWKLRLTRLCAVFSEIIEIYQDKFIESDKLALK